MKNHYHLLVQTPNANLGRIMRHINGVYTQRHNRLKKTDGSLFRGRYKAILVEEDGYLLQLSRYINKVQAPAFLHRETLYNMLGQRQKYQGYQSYVAQGNGDEIERSYDRTNIASVMGSQEFVGWLQDEIIPAVDDKVLMNQIVSHELSIKQLTRLVAAFYNIDSFSIAQKPANEK